LAPILGIFTAALSLGISAILIPQLQLPSSSIQPTEDELSWFASITLLSAAPSCFVGIYLMDKFGRKPTILISNIPSFIGWILMIFAGNFTMLLIGKFLTGVALGILEAPAAIYIGENR
jgi:MFS family permease